MIFHCVLSPMFTYNPSLGGVLMQVMLWLLCLEADQCGAAGRAYMQDTEKSSSEYTMQAEMEMSFWSSFPHWLHQKLSNWQLLVQRMVQISSKWHHFHITTTKHFLTHWGRVTHICVGKLTIIASDNGLSPDRRQAIIWTIAGILLIGPLGTNFSEILIGIETFSFTKIRLKMASAKWRPFVSASMC